MNKQQLASKIWESANKMRSKIEANEYKDYILGFIFYKFLSDKEVEALKKDGWTDKDLKGSLIEEDDEVVKYCQKNLGYFIAYENLFSTWIDMGLDFNVSNVIDALNAFSRLINTSHTRVFSDIFKTLQNGVTNLGNTSDAQTKAIRELIQLIKVIPMDGRQDYDVLGFIYEYLISMFAANAGKKAGEFYTPHEVSLLMSEIVANHLKDKDRIEIYDPTSGSGSLLINIGKCITKYINNKDNIKYYAQELKENTYNLTRMNLVMRGILPDNIVVRNGDTLEYDWPYFDENDKERTYNPLYVDAVVSNPPYSQPWDPTNKDVDPRYAKYGLAPKSKADYAFLLHDLYHIKPDGIMTIVLPHGVLFRGGEEEKIRKALIENNHIDTIIGLPANIFYGTGIPTIIMVLKQKRTNSNVLIIDASKEFIKVGKNNKLQASNIKKIVDTFVERKNIDKYSRVVSKDEIRKNGYNLNIPRYVDSSDEQETYDIYASIYGGIPNSEINTLNQYWYAFPGLKEKLFQAKNSDYSLLGVSDIKATIENDFAVKKFVEVFDLAFKNFDNYLKSELIADMLKLNPAQEENKIADNIFERLSVIPLIDKYNAYQLLDNEWIKIAADLEIIQTEGFNAVKQVDPDYVIRKKDGKDVEIQDGYIGHVIPFGLVQERLLKTEIDEIKDLQHKQNDVVNKYTELFENIAEDDKEGNADLFNEDNTAFVPSEVIKHANALIKSKETYAENSFESLIIKVAELLNKEKVLKKDLRAKNEALLSVTKSTIENLTDQQALELLEEKWIVPVVNSLNELPNSIIDKLVTKVSELNGKYETTLIELEQQIAETEKSLSTMLKELEGNEYDMKAIKEFIAILGRN